MTTPNRPKVSAEVAAQLAAKYPRHADVATDATVGDLFGVHRKYRMPDGSLVVLDEVEPVATPDPIVFNMTVLPGGEAEAGRSVKRALDALTEADAPKPDKPTKAKADK